MALFDLLVTCLLFLNSLAILNEDRFLAKDGWNTPISDFSSGASHGGPKSLQKQALGLIHAVSYMRGAA